MNGKSIAYVNIKNQEPSWKDDPFDLERFGFDISQGVTRLSPQRELELYAEELAARYATYEYDCAILHLSDLPEQEQSELTRLFLESIDREMDSEAIHGDDFSIENDYTCALLALLKNNTFETRENLAYITRRNITTYYKKSLQEILDDACQYFTSNMNQEDNCRGRWNDDKWESTGEYC